METKVTREDASGIKIEHGIPIPTNKAFGMTATMRKMKVGDSVVLPLSQRNSVHPAARHLKIKVATRKISATECRVWRVK